MNYSIQAKQPKHIPAEPSFWILIFGDLIVFAVMFVAFAWHRNEDATAAREFAAAAKNLNQGIGITNTLILMTSSFCVARALMHLRGRAARASNQLLLWGVLLGVGFISLKLFEYYEKASGGVTVTSNTFYEFYFTFTGVHLLHVVIGVLLLAYVINRNLNTSISPAENVKFLEGVACYWHMVDFLWVMLFTLFYLL